jgi:hypothetical protein
LTQELIVSCDDEINAKPGLPGTSDVVLRISLPAGSARIEMVTDPSNLYEGWD